MSENIPNINSAVKHLKKMTQEDEGWKKILQNTLHDQPFNNFFCERAHK